MKWSIKNHGRAQALQTVTSCSHQLWNLKCWTLGQWVESNNLLELMQSSFQVRFVCFTLFNLNQRWIAALVIHINYSCIILTSLWNWGSFLEICRNLEGTKKKVYWMDWMSISFWTWAKRTFVYGQRIKNFQSGWLNTWIFRPWHSYTLGRVSKLSNLKEL